MEFYEMYLIGNSAKTGIPGGRGYQIFAVIYRIFCKNLVHLSVIIFVVFIVQEWHICSYSCVCFGVSVIEGPEIL